MFSRLEEIRIGELRHPEPMLFALNSLHVEGVTASFIIDWGARSPIGLIVVEGLRET